MPVAHASDPSCLLHRPSHFLLRGILGMANVVIGGKEYPLLHPATQQPLKVLGPKDHKVEFHAGDGFNKKRVKPIDLGVFHWTGSENAVEQMVETLRQRKLGVEFAIAPDGTLYQFCDPTQVDTADAGIANARSWGVEIVNAGIRRLETLWLEPKYRKVKMGPRFGYQTMLHGKKINCWDFYPGQTITACALNKLMTEVIPTYSKEVCMTPGVVDILGTHPVKGAIGHYNITAEKLDPGTRFMGHLAAFMRDGKLPEEVYPSTAG